MERPIQTPLTADLPVNWQTNQIVSPDGVSVGLDEKHGYNYQAGQINAAQRGVNALNEAFDGVAAADHTHTAEQVGALPLSGGRMTGDLDMGAHGLTDVGRIRFRDTSTACLDFGVDMAMMDKQGRLYFNLEGSIGAYQDMHMTSHRIRGVASPVEAGDAANKEYVDTGLAGKAAVVHGHTAEQVGALSTRGGTMAGDIEMSGHNLNGVSSILSTQQGGTIDIEGIAVHDGGAWVPDPHKPGEAANKQYVDASLSTKANQAEVSAALAGKVNKGGDTMTGVLSFSDIMGGDRNAQIIQWEGETHIRNAAGDGSDYHDIVIKPDGLYYSGFSGGVPSSYQIAPPAPPQVYALPLAAGFADGGGGGASVYWKNQSMEVHVIVNVSAAAAAAGVAAVAVLPAGFRADRMYLFGCDVLAPDGRRGGQSFNVTPDGGIRYFGPPLTAGDILWGHLCFTAH